MSDSLKYGLFNLVAGFLLGLIVFPKENIVGFVAPGLSAGLCAFAFWKLLTDNPVSKTRVVIIGLLTGIFSHYFCWVMYGLAVGKEGVGVTLLAAVSLSLVSLIIVGWVSVALSMGIGFFIRYQSLKK